MAHTSSQTTTTMHSPASQRDVIGDYLFQKFILRNNDCARPKQIPDEPRIHRSTQRALDVCQTVFKEQDPTSRKETLSEGVGALVDILTRDCEASKSDELVNKLSPMLEQTFTGQSETLRPFLDVLIESGLYRDPDLPPLGYPLDPADSERAWKQEYQGTAHEILLRNIQTSSAYANSGALIQSSGYGKSRTVDEMATLIPTIPMNIGEVKQGAFPPPDDALTKIFYNVAGSQKPEQTLILVFKLLFELVRDLAKGFGKQDFAVTLHHYLGNRDNRCKLYTDLSKKLKQNSSQSEDPALIKRAYESFNELAELLPESTGGVQMIIYIDEAQTLDQTFAGGISMRHQMLKAIRALRAASIFFLFLSTVPRLSTPSDVETRLPNSARFIPVFGDPIAPFTEMPFDCHPSLVKDSIRPGLKLEEIQRFSFAVRFGRPLFWAHYEAMAVRIGEDDAQKATLDLAKEKLIGNASSFNIGNDGKLAILDLLLNFKYDPLRADRELAITMVTSHLRTVYSIPAHRGFMDTGYSSEPVLAEAALTVATTIGQTTSLGPMLSLYRDLDATTVDAIDTKGRGENVGKMVLLLAYTAAVEKKRQSTGRSRSWGYGCGLVDFLKELTGEALCRDVLVAVPDNLKGGAPLEETFKNSWVRFTHFVGGTDDFVTTTTMAWVAFIRGMAMIACHPQDDVCIPVLLDKDKPITEANMSSILVQFKAGYPRTSKAKVALREDEVKFSPQVDSFSDTPADPEALEDAQQAYRTRPYISLVMQLGPVADSNSASTPPNVAHFLDRRGGQPPAPPRNPQPGLLDSGIHPRYSLFYHGCSHKVYRCIPDTVEAADACRAFLQISPIFGGRPANRPMNTVHQIKPFWGAGPSCFSWIDTPYLNTTDRYDEPGEDGVLVGQLDDSDMDVYDDGILT